MNWFDVDKRGLEKILTRRNKAFVLCELIQNAWDEDTSVVTVTLDAIPGTRRARLVVEDDAPNGFLNLAHAYTLFAESSKKADAERRGRFNFGEKLVLACCESATIETVSGGVQFRSDGTRRNYTKSARQRGSQIVCELKATKAEITEILRESGKLIPPLHIQTTINGVPLNHRTEIASFEETLATEIADDEGNLRASRRKTVVEIYDPLPDENAMIYEMGIPIVETGDKYHVNVMQKVPLTLDRDNVPPSYLQAIRTFTLNATAGLLDKKEATDAWVRAAAGDRRCDAATVEAVMGLRFGHKRVAYDPSDLEANKLATASGYAVIHGGALSAGEWENVRAAAAIRPAGQVTPSPKPYSPDGSPLKTIPHESWTTGMERVARLAQDIAARCMRVYGLSVVIASEPSWPFSATYGHGGPLTLNAALLGSSWFDLAGNREEIIDLLIHEFGHEYESDHLSDNYYSALTRLAGRVVELALTEPKLFT